MAFDDDLGKGITSKAGLFEALVRDIQVCPDRNLAQKQELEKRLDTAIRQVFKNTLPHWRRYYGMTEMSVIYSLPANNKIREDAESYERIVYGAAKKILIEEGFELVPKECRWNYTR